MDIINGYKYTICQSIKMQTLPKILFLADEIPQSKNAGSILLLRLFQNYPAHKLLVIGRKPVDGADILDCTYLELKYSFFDRMRLSRLHVLFNTLEAISLINYSLPKELKNAVLEFQPDIIISVLQLYMYYSTAYKLSKKIKTPFALFVHDQPEEFQPVFNFFKENQVKKNARIYNHASVKMNISPQMEALLRKSYGSIGDVIYPLPSFNLLPRDGEQNKKLKKQGKFTIAYAGTPAYGYSVQLEEMIPSFQRNQSILRFYGTKLPSNLEGYDSIEYGGFDTSENTWNKIKQDCDAVILPYTWQKKYRKLYETHFPSKLPEYLSLGMPVIIIGPKYATGVIWGIENQDAALVIYERDPQLWDTALFKLKSDSEYRGVLGRNALIKRNLYFSPQVIRDNFLNLIRLNRK